MNLMDVNVSDQSLARGWRGGGEVVRRAGFGRGRRRTAGRCQRDRQRATGDRGLVDYYA